MNNNIEIPNLLLKLYNFNLICYIGNLQFGGEIMEYA